jgi:hypothetical protein
MEFKTQTAVAPHRDGLPSDDESLVFSSWSQEEGYDPPTIDQSHDVALVTKLLHRSHNCHAVCNEKILLWGLSGCG